MEDTKKKNKFNRRTLVLIVTVIALIVSYVVIRGNYLEMKEIGEEYISVFWRNLVYNVIIFAINFVFIFCSFYFTNRQIKKALQVFFDDEKKEMPKFPNKSISFIIALVGGISVTQFLVKRVLLAFSNSKFGTSDSIFNLDISFFILQKPFIKFMIIYLLVVVVATLAYSAVYTIIALNKSFDGVSRESFKKVDLLKKIGPRVRMLVILAALFVMFFMVINIGNEKFMGIELSDGTSYSLYGAGNADVTVKLWGYGILAMLTMFSISRAYKHLRMKSIRKVIGDIMIVPVYLILLAVVLALYQLIYVASNTLATNEKYIEQNINSTRTAYGITSEEKNIEYSGTITSKEINENSNLLSNIDIVTSRNVVKDLQSSKTSKGYYTYRNSQIEQYNINGVETLVYVTPREIVNANTTYSNKTYQYTHGYGTIITLAGSTNEYGNLKHIQNSFGDLSNSAIKTNEPRIYYGLENNNACVINSQKEEIDYVDEDSNKEVTYNYRGTAGLTLNFFDRLILGIKEGDLKLAFSGKMTSDSKIITNRNIINRAKIVMPYLEYDNDPYMVIDDSGNQYWVLDAYTTSNEYPFSQKIAIGLEEINYIRNSVKVIVNAYDGTMKFYITDRQDPIVMAYNNMYKGLFEDESNQVPEDISKHFVYPRKLYDIQSEILEKYHSIKPEVLYRGNDIWQIAETSVSGKVEKMNAYYTMCKTQDGKETLGLVLPYTVYGKQNLTSYIIGTYENGKPKLQVYRFSSNSNVLGPIQLETQLNEYDTIASDIASLNTTGTKITKNLMAIPVENTILYVETIYQQLINETTQKPTLKRVIVASGTKVAIGNNLDEALKNLLSTYAVDIEVQNNENIESLINSVIKANQNVQNSSKNGEWKLFGEDMQKLTSLIDELQVVVQKKEKEQKNTTNEVSTEISNNTF